jgi:hypothetical protein
MPDATARKERREHRVGRKGAASLFTIGFDRLPDMFLPFEGEPGCRAGPTVGRGRVRQ